MTKKIWSNQTCKHDQIKKTENLSNWQNERTVNMTFKTNLTKNENCKVNITKYIDFTLFRLLFWKQERVNTDFQTKVIRPLSTYLTENRIRLASSPFHFHRFRYILSYGFSVLWSKIFEHTVFIYSVVRFWSNWLDSINECLFPILWFYMDDHIKGVREMCSF